MGSEELFGLVAVGEDPATSVPPSPNNPAGMAGTMNQNTEEKPARVRFKVYMPVPNAPAVESPVSQAAVDNHVARCDAFIRQRNDWFIDASLRREIERVLLTRRS